MRTLLSNVNDIYLEKKNLCFLCFDELSIILICSKLIFFSSFFLSS